MASALGEESETDELYYNPDDNLLPKGAPETSARESITSKSKRLKKGSVEKDKGGMPAYLQYRDLGYMYISQAAFVSFFCDIDKC
uniref:Uncharacterized protein n=1 Tax=Amphimedon queenslandica TaxID=400682 RepID=A0A1X7TR65_AMPQE